MSGKSYGIIRKEEAIETRWSGGTTWEIFRYPENSSYENRDFIFRLSRAEIQRESSLFTSLPHYQRHLMLLAGEVVLVHQGKKSFRLEPFQPHTFDGGLSTQSFGKAQDYNLMVQEGQVGQLRLLTLSPEAKNQELPSAFLSLERPYFVRGYYCESGYLVAVMEKDTVSLHPGDQLIVFGEREQEAPLKLMGEGRTIEALVAYGQGGEKTEEDTRGFSIMPTWQDMKDATFVAYTNFRGASYFSKKRRELWYDPLMVKGIRRLERFYMPMVIFILGFLASVYGGIEISGREGVIYWVLAWLALDLWVITPSLYLWFLPLPIREHMKPLETLTPYEKELCGKELEKNPQLEKILKKYTITGRNVGDEYQGRGYHSFRDDDE